MSFATITPAQRLVDRAVDAFFRLDSFGRSLTAGTIRATPCASRADVRAAFERFERSSGGLDILVEEMEDEAAHLNGDDEAMS